MDLIIYYFMCLITGMALAAFFVGKELYKCYIKYKKQEKQLNRIIKLNNEVNKFKILTSIESQGLSITT